MATHIFRVTVRGRFADLDDDSRERLRRDADAHEALRAAFTREGTLTYDDRLDFFSYRYEVRATSDDGGDATEAAFAEAVAKADADLTSRGLAYRHLKPTGSDLTRIWE